MTANPEALEPCPHESFNADVRVNHLLDSGRFVAEVRINCIYCGDKFRFIGLPSGLDLNGASVSIDGTEAHLAIGTKATVANIFDGNCPVGYTVRKSDPPPRTYDGDVAALAPMLPDGWVTMDPSGQIMFWFTPPSFYEGLPPETSEWIGNSGVKVDGIKLTPCEDWRTSLRLLRGGKVVPV